MMLVTSHFIQIFTLETDAEAGQSDIKLASTFANINRTKIRTNL